MCTLFHKYNKTFKKFICSIFKLNMSKAINLDTHKIFLEHMYINSIQQPVYNSWSSPRKEPIVSASSLLSSPGLLMTFNYQSRNKITIQNIKNVTMLQFGPFVLLTPVRNKGKKPHFYKHVAMTQREKKYLNTF